MRQTVFIVWEGYGFMKRRKLGNSVLLVLTAFIWGIAFVAQSEGGDAVGPFTFNGIRSLIGGAVLLPAILFLDKRGLTARKPTTGAERKRLFAGGISCGVILFLASSLQQLGIYFGTSSGKAGFLTACYILLVPVLGLFFKKKCGLRVGIGMVLTIIGLYLLCMSETLKLQKSDLLLLACSLLFAVHILVIDYFSPLVDGVRMSCIQFFVCGILSLLPMALLEIRRADRIEVWLSGFTAPAAWITILYAGILSCGVAYTLQIIGQNGVNPTVASLLLSLESVFSVLADWAILHRSLKTRELLGCALIFSAIVLVQLPKKGADKKM